MNHWRDWYRYSSDRHQAALAEVERDRLVRAARRGSEPPIAPGDERPSVVAGLRRTIARGLRLVRVRPTRP